jgi:hypothetical protein
MNTKILMTATALYLGIIGFGLTFLPQEIAGFFNTETNHTFILTLQIFGSLYLGFGMMNWIAKNKLVGGIYNRPLVFGNLLHFLVSAFALIKVVGKYSEKQFIVILTISILYSFFAACFVYLLRKSPIKS